jgi:hypothetical protein
MVWRFLAAFLVSCGFASVAYAQCTTLPYTLTNGYTADASQVMANFNGIVNCGRFAGPLGIGLTAPTVTLEVQAPGVAGDGAYSASFITQFDQSGNAATRRILLTAENFRPTIQGQLLSSPSWVAGDLLLNPDGGSVVIGTAATPPSTFYVNGTAGGTNAWSSPSDVRLKTHIEPLTNALSLVSGLNGVRYRWRPVGERDVGRSLALPVEEPQIGFIAQEVARVVPEAVVAAKDAPDGTYALRESALVPVLVEAIKEQQAQIDTLRRDLEELKASKVKEARAVVPR